MIEDSNTPRRDDGSLEALNRGTWLLIACAAWAQQSTVSTKNYDLNGHPVAGVSSVKSNGSRSGGHS